MRFGKIKMFLLLNGLIAVCLIFYFMPWLFSRVTEGKIITPYETTTLHVSYTANGKTYYDSYMRNGIMFSQRTVAVRYLIFHPQTSRINSFMGMWAEPLAWWSVFLVASAMLLLTHNGVFSKGTIFQVHKKFPWISMEEYFPLYRSWYWWQHAASKDQEPQQENFQQKKKTPLLKDRKR